MFGYVYRTRNNLDGTFYIGQHHGEFDFRYLGSGLHLIRAVKKYGAENFSVELIESASFQAEIDALEIHFISVHKDCGVRLYNIHDGGFGHQPGHSMGHEVRAKISNTMKGRKRPNDVNEKLRLALTGKKRSAEFCANHSALMRGRRHSEKTKEKMSLAHAGKPKSESHRESIRRARKGIPHSPERIANIKASMERSRVRRLSGARLS